MALTRKMLKAMDIDEEKIEQIIEAHSETVAALKAEKDNYKEDAEKLSETEKELNKLKTEIAKNGNDEKVSKKDYDALKAEYDSYKNQINAKETHSAKEHAFRELLEKAGVNNKRFNAIVKVSNIDDLELDENGKIKDAEKCTEQIKSDWADFIQTTSVKGADIANPPMNNGSGHRKSKEEILSIKDTAERQKAISENLDLFGIN